MTQETATANRTSGELPAAVRPPQVQVIVRPPVTTDGRPLKAPDPPEADGATAVNHNQDTERQASADLPVAAATSPPARSGELPRSVASGSSNRRFGRIWYVPTSAIHPAATQLRKHIAADELQALAQSIREKGMAQPVLLRCRRGTADAFELIAGYRRWRAAILAEIAEIPAIVIDRIGDREALELALVENLQRRDLSVLEEAEAFRIMIDEHGQTHEQVAALTGRSRSQVSNTLRLLNLPPEVKEMIDSGRISFGHARALLATDSPRQLAVRIAEEQLTVRETERLVSAAAGPTPDMPGAPSAAAPPPPQAASRPAAIEWRHPAGAAAASEETAPADSEQRPDEIVALQAEIAQELGSIVEIRLDGRRPEVRIHTRSPQEAVTAARTIRDALQLLNMSRAMRRLAGSGRLG